MPFSLAALMALKLLSPDLAIREHAATRGGCSLSALAAALLVSIDRLPKQHPSHLKS